MSFHLADLRVDRKGTAALIEPASDVGTWGRFEQPNVQLGPRDSQLVAFTVTIPSGADPGDHLGALVATSQPQGNGDVQLVKRIATRLIITVPGDARPDLVVDKVRVVPDRWIAPRKGRVEVVIRNPGDIRLTPVVEVDGHRASGPKTIVSGSRERYAIDRPLPALGGSYRPQVRVTSRTPSGEGPTATARGSRFLFPWAVILATVILILAGLCVRELSHRLRQAERDGRALP